MRRVLGIIACLVWSCDQDPEVIVGRLDTPGGDAGTGGGASVGGGTAESFDCMEQTGPGGYYYCPYWEGSGSAELTAAPSATSVSFIAQSPADTRAGIAFQFDATGSLLDLSGYSSINLGIDITQGSEFEVFLGQGSEYGCSYVFSRSDSDEYSVGLRQAAWCMPSQCGFDLSSTGGLILADVADVSTLEATVTHIDFGTGVAAGSASALGAGIGPGGLCWFLVGWNDGTSSWVPGQVSSSSAYVRSHATGNAVAGMAFEIPEGSSLSQYQAIQLTADVSVTTDTNTFLVQGVREERGIIWRFVPQSGSYTYVLDLSAPESTFPSGKTPLTLDEIARFEIVAPTGGTSDLEANVTQISFVP